MKKCNCCQKVHQVRPENAKLALDAILPGFYFECDGVKENGERCNSTLIWPLEGKMAEAIFASSGDNIQELYYAFRKAGGQ